MKKEMVIALIGFVAASLTTTAYIPQVVKIWRNIPKPASDISLPMFAMLFVGISLWLTYGVLTGSWPIIAANGVTLFFSFSIILYKLIYG